MPAVKVCPLFFFFFFFSKKHNLKKNELLNFIYFYIFLAFISVKSIDLDQNINNNEWWIEKKENFKEKYNKD